MWMMCGWAMSQPLPYKVRRWVPGLQKYYFLKEN